MDMTVGTRDGLEQAAVVEGGGRSRMRPKAGPVGFTEGSVVGSEKGRLKGRCQDLGLHQPKEWGHQFLK